MAKKEPSEPVYSLKVEATDIMVLMRDGVRLAVDIYRPDQEGRFPVLLSVAGHNKFLQGPEVSEARRNQPAWVPLWCRAAEAGDSTLSVPARRLSIRSTGVKNIRPICFYPSYLPERRKKT